MIESLVLRLFLRKECIGGTRETTKTHILSVYAPDTSKSQEETDSFYDELQITMDKIPKQDEIMILGDFNGRIDNEVISGIKNRFNEETLNSNGEQLIQFCAHNELRINNTFYSHKQQHKLHYYKQKYSSFKNIDVRTLTSVNTGTNHHMVLAIMRNCVQRKTQNKPKVTEKLNIESLSDDTTKYLYQQRLRKAINENKILKDDTVELAWKRLSTNIRTAAEEALGKRKVKENDRYDVVKIGDHEGPNRTTTCAEYINPWVSYERDESEADSEPDGRL
ncbi:craniofacial development protein 2-like [Diorhabda sublineata]|uniref:craniofacial development protein 2-like n=1 Tax=Diorhabda sublineata TaxID=1163346 RepID=UPI0024E05741|nr:craniofacial development protein 2-like [Diorhabda sublineata]